MFETLKNAFKVKEIRKKIFITLLLLLVYRIGCYIPIPGLDSSEFTSIVEGNNFLTLMSSVTGGALANGTLFALGIGPYINASIIMQLLFSTNVVDEEIYKKHRNLCSRIRRMLIASCKTLRENAK